VHVQFECFDRIFAFSLGFVVIGTADYDTNFRVRGPEQADMLLMLDQLGAL
jgi:hypothetical protein